MQKWEYRVVRVPVAVPDEAEGILNPLGEEGWEVIGFQRFGETGTFSIFYFKRPGGSA